MRIARADLAAPLVALVALPAIAQEQGVLIHSIPSPPSGVQSGARLGHSVAVDGALTVVGAPLDHGTLDAGVVKVFDTDSGALLHRIANPSPAFDAQFGYAVAISGTRIVVGAPHDAGLALGGRAHVFDLASATPTVPIATLSDPGAAADDLFGSAVAISGSRVVIGAYLANDGANTTAGRVHVFDLDSVTPTVPALTLANPNPASGSWFGHSVAISGVRVVVGYPLDDTAQESAGSAVVFNLASATPAVQEVRLFHPNPVGYESFGKSVAISGARVAVGAERDDTGATEAGSAYVFDLGGATPTVPEATLHNPAATGFEYFGAAVAISGSRVVVGVPFDDAGAVNAGGAYLFDVASATPTVPLVTLFNSTPTTEGNFGFSVAISGIRTVVGVPGDDTGATDAGSAHGFRLDALFPGLPTAILNDPGPTVGDRFGGAIAVSGTLVVVGAPDDDTGADDGGIAYVYDLASATPTVPAFTLDNPGATAGSPPAGDGFGSAVAISGTWVVVGAPSEDVTAREDGIAYVYDLASATPTTPVYTLNNPTPQGGDFFGDGVAISGTRVAIGAAGDNTGADSAGSVHVYELTGATPTVPVLTLDNPSPAALDFFGHVVAMSGTRVVVGDSEDDTGATNAGRAFVYDIATATPTDPAATLDNPTPAPNDRFGEAVAISGARVVVGARFDNPTLLSAAGSAYVFDLAGATPTTPVATLSNPVATASDWFGSAVAISGTRVLVGAVLDDTGATSAGRAYVYDLASATPTVPVAHLDNPAPATEDRFGQPVAIGGTIAVVGAPQDDAVVSDKGSMYVFRTPRPGTTTLFTTGDAVPGGGGATWAGFGASPAISDAGALAFQARIRTTAGATIAGIFVGDPATPAAVALFGGVAPDDSGAQAANGARFSTFSNPVVDRNGRVTFGAGLVGGARGLWSDADGRLRRVAMAGEAPPGVPGARWQRFDSFAMPDGGVLFVAKMAIGQGGVTSRSDTGLWGGRVGALRLVAREGDPVGGRTIRSFEVLHAVSGSPGQTRAFNGNAEATFHATFTDGSQGLVVARPAGLTLLRATAEIVPLGLAVPVPSGAAWRGFGTPAINDAGEIGYQATITDGRQSVTGVFVERGAVAPLPVAFSGQTAPDRTGAPLAGEPRFRSFKDPLVDANGRAMFCARLADATRSRDQGLWSSADGTLRLLARKGDEPPGIPGAAWKSFVSFAMPDGPVSALFVATMRGVPATHDTGLWAVDSNGALRLLVREGDAIGGKTLRGGRLLDVVPGAAGQTRSFNDAGDVVALALFTDGSSAIVKITVP